MMRMSTCLLLGRAAAWSCLVSQRSEFAPDVYVEVVEYSNGEHRPLWAGDLPNNVTLRDLVVVREPTCSQNYGMMLNRVDCTPHRGGCQLNMFRYYNKPEMVELCADGGYTTGLAAVALVPPGTLITGARALCVGGGAGEAPTTLLKNFPNMRIDVLEPDPAIISVARDWFGFDHNVYDRNGTLLRVGADRDDRVRIIIDEGLRFLQRNAEGGWPALRYDFVFLDAFVDDPQALRSPPEFGTHGFCEALLRSVTTRGVVTSNIEYAHDPVVVQQVRHCDAVFHHRIGQWCHKEGDEFGVWVASPEGHVPAHAKTRHEYMHEYVQQA